MAIKLEEILTKPEEDLQTSLFDMRRPTPAEWLGMPSFEQTASPPDSSIKVNFATAEDRKEFAKRLGLYVTPKTNSLWFPSKEKLAPMSYAYTGPKMNTRYPVCIPSKGRARHQTTGRLLDRFGVDYRFFVEETEAEEYARALGDDKIVVMPFHDLGQGSIPARNYIWEWAANNGHSRHWVMDDNIQRFSRVYGSYRVAVLGGGPLNAVEDFADRYENIALVGLHHEGFISTAFETVNPMTWNSRIYSCTLIDTTLPFRWRGKYNEDTDLSLRVLKSGYCTALIKALLMRKSPTLGSKGKAVPGGNTDNVYTTGDHRKAFAESLRDQHPDCVEVVWRFNRWHHLVDYSAFKNNKPIFRPGYTPRAENNEYGMRLTKLSAAGPDEDSGNCEDEESTDTELQEE